MQPHPDSPLSNSYLPKLVHYISGSNDTILHRLIGEGQQNKFLTNLTFKTVKLDEEVSNAQLYLQIIVFLYVLIGLTHLINEYLMRT